MRASVANASHYVETEVAALAPSRDGLSWHSARLHHADIHLLPGGTWGGFVDGDRCARGGGGGSAFPLCGRVVGWCGSAGAWG